MSLASPVTEEKNPVADYWANQTALDLSAAAFEKVKKFYERLPRTTMYKRWCRASADYWSLGSSTDVTRADGPDGDISLAVKHAASITKRMISLVTSVMPAFDVIPEQDT